MADLREREGEEGDTDPLEAMTEADWELMALCVERWRAQKS